MDDWLAWRLTSAFAGDGYFTHYFHQSVLGTAARFLLFRDDIRLRRKFGLVLRDRNGLALVGLPPRVYLDKAALGVLTRLAIQRQGEPYLERWEDLWSEFGESDMIAPAMYLSALAAFPGHQGQGVGTRLLRRVIEEGRNRQLNVECEVSSLKLVAWYEKRGFRLLRERPFSPSLTVFEMLLETDDTRSR